jgi:hypothetical protein
LRRISAEVKNRATITSHAGALLRWTADAIARGFITFSAAHTYATLPAAAQAWIEEHYADLPPPARPPRAELAPFARFFASFLETSFELVEKPGKRLYSPDAHCFCPMCSWLVDVPHLRTKKLVPADKARAEKSKLAALHVLAVEASVSPSDAELEALLAAITLREQLALVAYGRDLLERTRGGRVARPPWRCGARSRGTERVHRRRSSR